MLSHWLNTLEQMQVQFRQRWKMLLSFSEPKSPSWTRRELLAKLSNLNLRGERDERFAALTSLCCVGRLGREEQEAEKNLSKT